MKLTLSRTAEFMQAAGEFDAGAVASGYSIDSRTVQPGDLFFAVRGERLDGHDFVEAALAKGAVGAVVGRDQRARFAHKNQLLVVEDPLLALQRLDRRPPALGQATYRRHRISGKDHDQGSHCARAGDKASRVEIPG